MKTNESSLDRIARIVVAVVAAIVAVSAGGALGVALWIVTAIMVVTAVSGFCPLYRVFGISTCKIAPAKK